MINSLTLPGNIRGFSRRDNSSLPICIRSGYFIPVCSRDKFSNSRQIHPVGASKSLIVSFFILDISVIIRFLLRVKSIGVFGVSICLHSLVLVQGCLHDKNQLHSQFQLNWLEEYIILEIILNNVARITRVQYKFFCYLSFAASCGSVTGICWAAVLWCVILIYDFHGCLSSR